MKYLLTFFLLLGTFVSYAQNETIDSLQQALKNYNAQKLEQRKSLLPDERDTTSINILNELSRQFWQISDFAAARKDADEALSIAQQLGYKKGVAFSYHNIGTIHALQGNYPEALHNLFIALNIRKEIGDKKGIEASYGNIANVYSLQGNYSESLKINMASLKISEEIGDKYDIAFNINNIGIIYKEQGNYPEALKYTFNALNIFKEIGEVYGIESCYGNIGLIYQMQGKYQEALKYFFAAIELNKQSGHKQNLSICYNNVGATYSLQNKYTEALKYYFDDLKIVEEIGDKNGIAESYNGIGVTKLRMGMPGEAKDWLLKGLQVEKEIKAIPNLKESYAGLAQADSALGNFKDAYENYKLFIFYRDSLINEEVTKKTLQAKMQYEFDKKEVETKAVTDAELKKQKVLRNGFVGGFAIVLLFAGVFFRQRNKTEKEKQRAEEEKKRSEELLLNILPGEVAEEIKTSGTAKAKAFTMVTVMFTDFKDFTTMSEKISAELLVDEIHACFSAFDHILDKYNIEKIKTIGDAYLCASGLPVSTHTHAIDMLNAAIEIRDYMLQRKKEKEAKGEIPFELRIGIHTGPVVAGVVGVKKYAYDIWGDTVNIAARMEQNSEAGKINISGATYELVKDKPVGQADKFRYAYRGKIKAKNKGEIDMYFVET